MASTSALVSRALLLLTVALLLLECVVWCDMVGFAKHMKDGNNKIIKLGTGSGTDCVVEAGPNAGDMIIKYKKGQPHATKGCSIDLLTNPGGIQLEFSVTGNLMECLTDAVAKGTGVKDERVGDENLFPFTFSLPEEGFKKLVDSGLQTGAASECNKLCVEERSGKCLLSTDFAVAFGRRGDWMLYNVHILGEPRIWYCPSTKHKAESNSSIIVKFDPKAYSGWRVSSGHHCARENGLDYDKEEKYCHTEKVLRKAEQWEITDEAHKDTDFKYLFTLNILPLKIVPGHKSFPQAIDYSNMLDGNKGPKCELSLRLSGSRFKQFVGSTPAGTPPTDGKTGPGGSTVPVDETTTSGPSSGAEASGSNMGLIIGIVIAVVVLLAVVGGLVWFFVLRGKGEEEEGMEMGMTGAGGTKTKTKVGGTTVGATQAKTGGMTTVGGTQAKTGGATTAGGATSKAAGTTKGGATSKAGGATSKK
uniref:Uncharacterized protein n=1 Tax=Meloidogyne enterolobii TaxID=390850 RepID=A0A6V7WU04_MELEN|nr:unnamed protein product [Meloidogyne enterolobii]CAD2196941.1 unnamed protein product [Meloidogyne enterolobii]